MIPWWTLWFAFFAGMLCQALMVQASRARHGSPRPTPPDIIDLDERRRVLTQPPNSGRGA